MTGAHQLRSARDWFTAAEACYAQEHQGCPACRRRHCVFRSQWGARVEYYCTACDFSTARDAATDEALFSPGSDADFGLSLDLLAWAHPSGPAPLPAQGPADAVT